MSRFEGSFLVVVSWLVYISGTLKFTETRHVLHEVNDKLLTAIDDLFIALKIDKNFTKSNKSEEYMSAQSFIQDTLSKNVKIYEEMHNTIKNNISNETTDQIETVNRVLDEMIREYTVSENRSNHSHNRTFTSKNEGLNEYLDVANIIRSKLNLLLAKDAKLQSSNISSLEVPSRRIFAGTKTSIKRYPFIASVHVADRFICAGSLMTTSLAISAASCVVYVKNDPATPVQLRVGSDYVGKLGSIVTVHEVILHPQFDRTSLANNLAFLRTKTPLRFVQKKVVAIKYDKMDTMLSRNSKDVVILGWGRRSAHESDGTEDRPLSRAHLDMFDIEECKYIYTSDYVTKMNFCAGFTDKGDGACNHDGGGPAVAGSLLVGVISFGSPRCGRTDAPTVFTRLDMYADWIDSILNPTKVRNGPKTFDFPSSIEFEVDKITDINMDETEADNPQERLKQEFGLNFIMSGPIEPKINMDIPRHSNKGNNANDLSNEHPKLDFNKQKQKRPSGPKSSPLAYLMEDQLNEQSNTGLPSDSSDIVLLDQSPKPLTAMPPVDTDEHFDVDIHEQEILTTVKNHNKHNNTEYNEMDPLPNIFPQFIRSTVIGGNNSVNEYSHEGDLDFLFSSTTEALQAKHELSILLAKHHAKIAFKDLSTTQKAHGVERINQEKSEKDSDKSLSLSSDQSDMEFGNLPSFKQTTAKHHKKAVVLMEEAGTTTRLTVDNSNIFYKEVLQAVQNLAKAMNKSFRSKANNTNIQISENLHI